jgi:hypothetical protein
MTGIAKKQGSMPSSLEVFKTTCMFFCY